MAVELIRQYRDFRVTPLRYEMRKKLTNIIDQPVYDVLYRIVGRHRISCFIESLLRFHLGDAHLDRAYCEMAQAQSREADAIEWIEAVGGDVGDETR